MELRFSLIVATYGRREELRHFLKSVCSSSYSSSAVEVIIVDQNDDIDIGGLLEDYSNQLNIVHLRVPYKGLSRSRNYGLTYASGAIVAFPDDDCEYLVDTLKNVEEAFARFSDSDLVLGKIIDRNANDSIRKWPTSHLRLNAFDFFTKSSSITVFVKRQVLGERSFNERLGIGSTCGSCEDSDLIYSLLKKGRSVTYTPDIRVYHPSSSSTSEKKIANYGRGFGGFCMANLDFPIITLFVVAMCYQTLCMLALLITGNLVGAKRRLTSIVSRFQGLSAYGRT